MKTAGFKLGDRPEPTIVFLAAGQGKRFGGCKPLAPVGSNDEALIDIVASDALAAGFRRFVLVVNNDTGPRIRAHVAKYWPSGLSVEFSVQERPTGTVTALATARELVDPGAPFAVSNADDIYGQEAFECLHEHLVANDVAGVYPRTATSQHWALDHVLVAFRLSETLISKEPVTRGTCDVGTTGHLVKLNERRQIARRVIDRKIQSADGRSPKFLADSTLVSMNLWGFQPSIWEHLEAAIADSGHGNVLAFEQVPQAEPIPELLLPEVVGSLLAWSRSSASRQPGFRALLTESRCIGVTHPGDLATVQRELAVQIALGLRAPELWSAATPNASLASNAAS